jgi:hypothetical protein
MQQKERRPSGHEKNPAKKGRVSEAVLTHREAGGTSKAELLFYSVFMDKNREVYF